MTVHRVVIFGYNTQLFPRIQFDLVIYGLKLLQEIRSAGKRADS